MPIFPACCVAVVLVVGGGRVLRLLRWEAGFYIEKVVLLNVIRLVSVGRS